MAKSENQKLKLYTVLQILKEETDEEHYITMPCLIAELERRGIAAERKSVADDVRAINDGDTGYEIEYVGNRGYHLIGRIFENEELAMLADIIGAAHFITAKKSGELLDKLCKEASRYERAALKRKSMGTHIKMENEAIYYNLNTVQTAIRQDRQISFSYYKFNRQKEFVELHPGKRYTVSPWNMVWDNKNYYLVAVSDENKIVHFRLDRIKNAEITDQKRIGKESFAGVDMGAYESKAFGMFGGEECRVNLLCREEAAGAIIDRFGTNVGFRPKSDGTFNVSVTVLLSPQFYAWLCGLSDIVSLVYPPHAIAGYRNHLQKALALSENPEG
ncbi:MAG: WYL domain-containing protein [Clostridia bacterium]|nr:WYL domain-containing protein [Clostridia bacterium]